MLTRQRRGDLALILVPLALYAVNQRVKTQVPWPAAGYLLRCHFNDYLGGAAFAAYLNLILSSFPPYMNCTRLWNSPSWKRSL